MVVSCLGVVWNKNNYLQLIKSYIMFVCGTDSCCQTPGPHEAVKNKEARQQSLWWFHVCQVCTRQVTNFKLHYRSRIFKYMDGNHWMLTCWVLCMTHVVYHFSGSRELFLLRSRRLSSKYWRHRHRAKRLSKCGFVLFKIKDLETTVMCLSCAFLYLEKQNNNPSIRKNLLVSQFTLLQPWIILNLWV